MPAFVTTTIFHFEIQPTLDLPTAVDPNTTCTPPSALLMEHSSLDDFFRSTLSTTSAQESEHGSIADVLPSYFENMPPIYSLKAPEPLTLTEYLFKSGFLFPPLWILGAWILWMPLRTPKNSGIEILWLADKTESEYQYIIGEMRRAEVRWALRCIWALFILVLLGISSGIATWAILHL
ncbi:hypothetical protein C0993_007740 [Termitomyces sp. T159_Od127]|nr:hypothetical protein C0993_007740 [Termitomyces sp. T159_Od127]